MIRRRTRSALGILLAMLAAHACAAAEFWVSPNGSDRADGTRDHPFATLERAREAARRAPRVAGAEVAIVLRGGAYGRQTAFVLRAADSGSADCPVVYRAEPGAPVEVTGAVSLPREWFHPVAPDSEIGRRLPPASLPHVRVVALREHGIRDPGVLVERGMHRPGRGAAELFCDGKRLPLAQWPEVEEADLVGMGEGFARIERVVSPRAFVVKTDRMARWAHATDAWLHGYWGNMWADFRIPAAAIDAGAHTITLKSAPPFGMKAGQPFRIYNLPEELTRPGEWYLDRGSGELCVWPPDDGRGEMTLSMANEDLVRVEGASHVVFENVEFEQARNGLLAIHAASDVVIRGCRFHDAGGRAVTIEGVRCGLESCAITDNGAGGVALSGGSRAQLVPGQNFVRNCAFARDSEWVWTYTPCVSVSGVGQVIAHNRFSDTPHSAILFSGNNHLIEFNEISHVCRFTSDAGAIYGGRQWAFRGTDIRYNFIHDLSTDLHSAAGIHGIYLDDVLSGERVFGNVLFRIADAAIQSGGGRDNVIENNVIARCGGALVTDGRATHYVPKPPEPSWDLIARLSEEGVRYQEPPWSLAYPALAAMPHDLKTLTAPGSRWLYPEGVIFARNVAWQNRTFIRVVTLPGWPRRDDVLSSIKIQDNLVDVDPRFQGEAELNLALRPDSPAYRILGFVPIPFDRIGPVPH